MRRITRALLLVFVFAIPWEYSLDLGEPLGNVARIAGLLVLLAAAPAILQAGRIRTPDTFCLLTLALYLWFCVTGFWTVDATVTLIKLRAYLQEYMIVWLVWEFTGTPDDLRDLLRAAVMGSWVLAVLTLAAFRSPEAMAAGQIRFAAYGQDPNDVARYLALGFAPAALLVNCERRWPLRAVAAGFLPVGAAALLLTASRGGFLAALVALGGSLILLFRGDARRAKAAAFALPPFLAALWMVVPGGTIARLATIPEQLQGGDLNQRINIWSAGWRAFARSPVAGSGAGTFVAAARTAPIDSAHNTYLSIAVSGGLCALLLLTALVALAARAVLRTRGPLRLALATCLLAWTVTSLVATVEENRTTWLLFGIAAAAARLSEEAGTDCDACFSWAREKRQPRKTPALAAGTVT